MEAAGHSDALATLRERGFTEEILDELVKGSAISPDTLLRFGVGVVHSAKEASKMFGGTKADWEAGRLPAWHVGAYLPFHRDPVLQRAKPRRPFERRKDDGSIELAKYKQPARSGVHVFYGHRLRTTDALSDTSVPLWITEGEKKCMAAESAGLCCLALFGVSQWHVAKSKMLHPELDDITLEGRTVYLAFDRDAVTNHQVRQQELELGRVLEKKGARVRVVRFPEDAPKLDDFLATHERTELAELIADAEKHGQLPPDTTAPDENWQAVFEELRLDFKTGLPARDPDNIARILMLHPLWKGTLGHDVRTGQQIILREPPFFDIVRAAGTWANRVPRELVDEDAVRISDWLIRQPCLGWKSQPTVAMMDAALKIACRAVACDPVMDYLDSLKWDGTARLDAMAPTYFGAPDTDYARAVMSKWMLSAVARAVRPGCQADHVLILEGNQGAAKGSALRLLAGDAHFSDSMPHDLASKDAKEHLCGPWIVELGELSGLRRTEVEAVKAFITCRVDRFRPAYGHRTKVHERRCVFAGTTNEAEYLRDPSGNRRFWPVQCTHVDLEALKRDRDQLWAEAYARVQRGEPWHITDEVLLEAVEAEQQARREVDPWHEPIQHFIRGKRAVTVMELLDHLGEEVSGGYGSPGSKTRKLQFDQRAANRVARLLRELGWKRRQATVNGARFWRYEPPDPSPKRGAAPLHQTSGEQEVGSQPGDFAGESPPSPGAPPQFAGQDFPANDVATSPSASFFPSTDSNTFTTSGGEGGGGSDYGDVSGVYDRTTLAPVAPQSGAEADSEHPAGVVGASESGASATAPAAPAHEAVHGTGEAASAASVDDVPLGDKPEWFDEVGAGAQIFTYEHAVWLARRFVADPESMRRYDVIKDSMHRDGDGPRAPTNVGELIGHWLDFPEHARALLEPLTQSDPRRKRFAWLQRNAS